MSKPEKRILFLDVLGLISTSDYSSIAFYNNELTAEEFNVIANRNDDSNKLKAVIGSARYNYCLIMDDG